LPVDLRPPQRTGHGPHGDRQNLPMQRPGQPDLAPRLQCSFLPPVPAVHVTEHGPWAMAPTLIY
jgi:hypothetical protein